MVDASEEPFKWGLPDLDGLRRYVTSIVGPIPELTPRSFFHEELSWNANKVDELLLPIIHKMNKKSQVRNNLSIYPLRLDLRTTGLFSEVHILSFFWRIF